MPDYPRAAVLENVVEAQILRDILQERSIPYLIESHHDGVYGGIFQLQKGWGAIYAPEEHHQEINELIHELRNFSSLEELEDDNEERDGEDGAKE